MPTWMFLAGITLLCLALFAASVREWRRYPHRACPACTGGGKARQPGRPRFYGPCRRCGGSGARTRDGVRFLDWLNGRRDER
jgi:hypothetical protein